MVNQRKSFPIVLLLASLVLVRAASGGSLSKNDSGERELRGKRVPPPPFARGMIIVPSTLTMPETYGNLIGALSQVEIVAGIIEFDHAAQAADAGLDLLPNKLVLVQLPSISEDVLKANPMSTLDLIQFLVWQDAEGRVFLGYNPPEYFFARHKGIRRSADPADFQALADGFRTVASFATGVAADNIQDPPKREFKKIKRNNAGIMSLKSDSDFETTWTRLTGAIDAAAGPEIFFTIDFTEGTGGALTNGLQMVVFGNANIGTPLMVKSATAGIDVPLKILVSEMEDGTVRVTTNTMAGLKRRHRLFGLDSTLKTAQKALNNFMKIAAGKK